MKSVKMKLRRTFSALLLRFAGTIFLLVLTKIILAHYKLKNLHTDFFVYLTFSFIALFLTFRLYKKLSNIINELHEKSLWLDALLDSSNYSVISATPNGIISTFNAGAEKLLGYKSSEVIGKVTPAILHDLNEVVERSKVLSKELGKNIEPGFDVFVEKAKSGIPDMNEWTYIRKNGERFPVRLCVTAIRDSNNELMGFVGIAEDLTEYKKLSATVDTQKANMLNSAKFSILGEMAGGIAHEINTPLAIISGKASVLIERISSEKGNADEYIDHLEKIKTTANRIAKIVKGLRLFSRNSEKDPFNHTSLNQIIESSMDLCREKLKQQGIKLNISVDNSIFVNARAVEISQVIMNLIGNSIDAIQNIPEKWIDIEVFRTEKFARVQVTDCGDGIPHDVAAKIMTPFFTTKEIGKGTGLGLSISKGIIESHGGKFNYDKNSKHTRFYFDLPLVEAEKKSVA